jgi:hypothetical protein
MRVYAGIGAAVTWFALALQLALLLTGDSELSVTARFFNFFSYFTILSNILVAITLTVAAFAPGGWFADFFRRPSVQTGIAIYIAVTGAVYSLILRAIWEPEGWHMVANELLHDAVPLIYLGFWVFFVRRGTLSFANVPWFIAFPIGYAIYSLIRGPIVDWYPYPFIDASELATGELIVNILGLAVAFIGLAFLFVYLDRWLARIRIGAAAG